MYRINIIGIEKTEVLRELADEFFRPSEYIMKTVSSQEECVDEDDSSTTIFINENDSLDIEGAKRELFHKLCDVTGQSPLWGTLTGVRPVKLAGELIERMGEEAAFNRLREYYLLSSEKTHLVMDMYKYQMETFGKADTKSVSCYIGIPFCPTRCLYCSFASNQKNYEEIERYLVALKKEIRSISEKIKANGLYLESIYIGGGTPTTLNAFDLESLMETVSDYFDLSKVREYTVEAGRPDTIDIEKLNVIKAGGAKRISINPQSMNERTLELIGRSHTPQEIEKAFEYANNVGFESINCDLIAGLPSEDVSDMEYSLGKVLGLGADNITVHCLAVKRASRLIEEDPDYHYKRALVTSEMLTYADEVLKDKGYKPYYLYRQKHMAGAAENTGYSLPGKEGLYNVRIMDEHQSIVAMGAGGISKKYIPEINRLERIPNVTNYEQYIERIDEMIKRKDILFNAN